MALEVDTFGTMTIAMLVFFIGYAFVMMSGTLRDYAIPEPLIGGVAFAIGVALLYGIADIKITFDLDRRDILLVYFFAALGLRSSLRDLITHGRPLLILVALATVFILIQNTAGIGIAYLLGYDPQMGIVGGSMSLIGRSGTTVAWAPIFREQFGIDHVSRLGLAANMAGLIAACCLGGPIARSLIKRYRLVAPGPSRDLEVTFSTDIDAPKLDYRAILLALLRIHITIIGGQLIGLGIDATGLHMPLYVSCLLAGIILGNLKPRMFPPSDWQASDHALTLLAYVSLGLFYSMTLMSQQLWTAGEFLVFLLVAIIVQVVLAVAYTYIVVFRVMGRDYEAAVIAAGFIGIALGSTATTMAIMTAIAKQYGRAHKAFVIVPLACGIFIDIINSLAITFFATL